ncbi:TPA: DUF551 domain-containing protein [Yersinia enterocolitica]|nr:DUF551 domain-containing protein [Yersinia enterocolitica]
MKELDSFTVERLEEIIAEEGYSAMITPKNDEVRALARIALAAKRAEPVYQYHTGIINEEGDIDWYWVDCDKGFYSQYDNQHRRIVYTTPQLNSQVPLGSWINCSDQMPESQQWGLVWAKWFNQQVLCWEDVGGQWTDFDGQSYSQDQITHWMPLPAAPEKENG